jgi:monofunctional biosynthetic peptidoglycan transglycosylase
MSEVQSGYQELFRFDGPGDLELWPAIDDVVMGGRSASRLYLGEGGIAVFSGHVSLENNGGFASVRSRPKRVDLGDYVGVELRVRGDGKRYRLRLHNQPGWGAIAYQAAFETVPGVWQTIRFPFSAFRPTFRGRSVPDAPPLDPGQIYTFGLMIADKQAGPFALELEWIRAYAKAGQEDEG